MQGTTWVIPLLSVLLATPPLRSQEPPAPAPLDSLQLSEVIVTAPRLEVAVSGPWSVTIIPQERIEASGQATAFGVVGAQTPGLHLTGRGVMGYGIGAGSAGHVSIRGVGGISPNTQLLVLVDGVPQLAGLFGHPIPDTHLALDFERIEVIRGPASALFGSHAMAGAINLVTRGQARDGLTARGLVQLGTFNTQRYMGSVGYRQGMASLYASAHHSRTEGHRQGMDFNQQGGVVNARLRGRRAEVGANISLTGFESADPGPVRAPSPFGAQVFRGSASLWVHNVSERSPGSLTAYYNYGDHQFSDGWQSTDALGGVSFRQALSLFRHGTLTFGGDWRSLGGRANRGVARDQWIDLDQAAAYLHVQQGISMVSVAGGLRLEYSWLGAVEWAPHGGLSVALPNHTQLRTSFAKGFRTPTLMELHLFMPNPALQPERMWSWEIGATRSLLRHALLLELVAFYLEGRDVIEVLPNPHPPPPGRRQNAGTFGSWGLELPVSYWVGPHLSLSAHYSLVITDRPRLAVPRHQLHAEAGYTLGGLRISPSVQHIGGLYTQIGDTPSRQRFTLVNLQLAHRLTPGIQLTLSGKNLLDQSYSTIQGYPMPGFNLWLGLNLRLDRGPAD